MNFILKGNICYSRIPTQLETIENGYLVCEEGVSKGAFPTVPEKYSRFPITDYGDSLIIPGLCDLHVHAPQYTFRGLGMDLELIGWLNAHTFPEESKYADSSYAHTRYDDFVGSLQSSATTRACIFATMHVPATLLLMEKLEKSGLVTFVGKVNMDRNSPDILCEESAVASLTATSEWLKKSTFKNTYPIITPRFIPTCSDALMDGLGKLQKKYNIPVQSHLSENRKEIEWVKALHPDARSYGAAYDKFGLFGGDAPTIMAHCVWTEKEEEALVLANGVYVAHCPQSNMNLASGIAPIRRFLNQGIRVGLGSDVAGGCHLSIFRAMSDAVQVSKLHWRLVNQDDAPLTEKEAFYLATLGGGSFFGKVGSFDEGYEFDAVVINDTAISDPRSKLSLEDRLARIIYLSDDCCVSDKYVRGEKVWER